MKFKSKERWAHCNGTKSGKSKDLSIIITGALAGAAAGSVISGLFTQKGIEVRKNIGKSGKKISTNVKHKVADIADNIADKYEAVKENASDVIEKGKQKVENLTRHVSHKHASHKKTGSHKKGTPSKVLFGALAASVAGTIIWSFASEKGVETRKRLSKGSKSMATNLKEKVSAIADNIADTYATAKEGAADLLEKEKQQADVSSPGTAYKSSGGTDTWEG